VPEGLDFRNPSYILEFSEAVFGRESKMKKNKYGGNNNMTDSQLRYLNELAQDFKCDTMDDLARKLGYRDSNHMAQSENHDNIYDYWKKSNFVAKYLQIKSELGLI